MLSSTLHIFFAVAVYVERGGGRRRFPSVFHDFTPDNCLTRLNAGAVRIVGTAGMVQVVENPRGSRSSLSIEVPMQGCPPWRSAMPNKLPKRPIIVFLAGIFLGLPGVAGAVTLTSLNVRRQNIWRNSRRRLAECRPRLGVDVRRRACGVASADARWSFA